MFSSVDKLCVCFAPSDTHNSGDSDKKVDEQDKSNTKDEGVSRVMSVLLLIRPYRDMLLCTVLHCTSLHHIQILWKSVTGEVKIACRSTR